jgi:hypothetical protein
MITLRHRYAFDITPAIRLALVFFQPPHYYTYRHFSRDISRQRIRRRHYGYGRWMPLMYYDIIDIFTLSATLILLLFSFRCHIADIAITLLLFRHFHSFHFRRQRCQREAMPLFIFRRRMLISPLSFLAGTRTPLPTRHFLRFSFAIMRFFFSKMLRHYATLSADAATIFAAFFATPR